MGNRRITRSDKKKDVKPTISELLKTRLYYFAEFCDEPIKDVGERLCNSALVSPIIIEEIRPWIRRDYRVNNTIVLGEPNKQRVHVSSSIDRGKVTIKFKQHDYDQLSALAYSLDLTPTTTAAILLRLTLDSRKFMKWYCETYLRHMNESDIRNVYKILKI